VNLEVDVNSSDPVVDVASVSVGFPTRGGMDEVVHSISFSIAPAERVGLVGESGSGKSLTARAIMKLIPKPGVMTSGSIAIQGRNTETFTGKKNWRGSEIAIVSQDPLTSLNPLVKIGLQIMEMLTYHKGLSKNDAERESISLLKSVGLPNPERTMKQYPNSLSGGMRQRVAIAIAISCKPKLLIADEPTTSLDVTIQSQVLDLMETVSRNDKMAVLLISHDLAVVANFCSRIIVMYNGRIVESGLIEDIVNHPKHPYTQALIASVPDLYDTGCERLQTIPGSPPIAGRIHNGCSFAPRCSRATDLCLKQSPILSSDSDSSQNYACHNPIPRVAS